MMDLMLRFDTEEQAIAAMPMLRGVDEAGTGVWLTASHHHALDPIGPVVTTPAVVDDEGNVVTPAVVDDRWHANLRLSDACPDCDAIMAAVEGFTVNPANPVRVWA